MYFGVSVLKSSTIILSWIKLIGLLAENRSLSSSLLSRPFHSQRTLLTIFLTVESTFLGPSTSTGVLECASQKTSTLSIAWPGLTSHRLIPSQSGPHVLLAESFLPISSHLLPINVHQNVLAVHSLVLQQLGIYLLSTSEMCAPPP